MGGKANQEGIRQTLHTREGYQPKPLPDGVKPSPPPGPAATVPVDLKPKSKQ